MIKENQGIFCQGTPVGANATQPVPPSAIEMSRNHPNFWWLYTLMSPLGGRADDDAYIDLFQSLNSNDEAAMREMIRERFVPSAKSFHPRIRDRVLLTYRYYLTRPYEGWGELFDSNLLPFEHPNDARSFFLWLFQECFPGEEWLLPHWESYERKDDIDEPYRLRMEITMNDNIGGPRGPNIL